MWTELARRSLARIRDSRLGAQVLDQEPVVVDVVRKAWLHPSGDNARRSTARLLAVLAETELARGNHFGLQRIARRMLDRRVPLGHYYLATSAYLYGDFDEAVREARRLLELCPSHADGTFLLAEALVERGEKDDAFRLLEDFSLRTGRVKVWQAMSNLVETSQDFARLSASFDTWMRSSRSKGFDRYAYEYLASGAARAGDYGRAREIWREALLHVASTERHIPSQKPRSTHYSQKRAERALLDLQAAVTPTGIRLFLVSGTLLGCIREGRLLAHDKDVDVGVFKGVDERLLMRAIRGSGLFYVLRSRSPHIIRLKHVSGAGIDVFFHLSEPDDVWHGGVQMIWHNRPFDLVEREFLGRSAWVPDDCERYLTENYGDWRTPVIDFDTFFDTPNGEVIHEDELALHVYRKLLDALVSGDDRKFLFYLEKLRALGDRDFADGLAAMAGMSHRIRAVD